MARLSDEARADLVRQINNIPEILECYTVFGEMDVMMKVVVPDVLWYQEFGSASRQCRRGAWRIRFLPRLRSIR